MARLSQGIPTVLSPKGGLEIVGIDASRPLPPGAKDAILAGLLVHHFVVLPGQALSRERQFAFAAQLGEVEVHGGHRSGQKRYEVAHILSNLDEAGRPTLKLSPAANYHWHTDKPYHAAPPSLTMLHAVELPPAGGDTEFANTALAYDALPEDAKCRIAGLRVIFRPAFDQLLPAVAHPLVRTHPATGRQSLYLGNHAIGVEGMPEQAGRALLAELLAHATEPRFVYTHRWRLGDLVIWDNRCLLHRAVANYDASAYRRILYRSVVRGGVPF